MADTTVGTANGASRHDRDFVLQKVQPALLGFMDGSVSTLAPLFAAAGLTGNPMSAFYVGLAAFVGAGISMGLAEALSDDGTVTGRGDPWGRGVITGVATIVGGMLHTIPFSLPNLTLALHLAYVVVALGLLVIAYIRWHYMRTALGRTIAQVVVGGAVVCGRALAGRHRLKLSNDKGCPVAAARLLLRKAGLRATAQRCSVAWLLTGRGSRHITPDSLHAEATKAKINISLSSVYNILKRFTDAGILRQRTFPDGRVVYDTDISDHRHFLDEDTGEVSNLDGASVPIEELPPIPDGYAFDGVELVVTVRRKR